MSLLFEDGVQGAIRLYPSGVFTGESPECCPRNGASTWHSTDTGPFSVLLPPGWKYEPAQGTDSFVGTFAGEGVELQFDYGWYTGDPEDPADPTQRVHHETIAGRTAKIVTSPNGYTALLIQVSPDPPDDPNAGFTPVDRIAIWGDNLSSIQTELVHQIFRSARFEIR